MSLAGSSFYSAADRGAAYARPRVVGPVQPDDKHGAVHKNALDLVEWEMLLQGLAAAAKSLEGVLPRAAALVDLHAEHSADDVHLDLAGAAGVSMDVSALGSRVSTVGADHYPHRDGFHVVHHLR